MEELITDLTSEDLGKRREAIYCLMTIKSPGAIKLLIEYIFSDTDRGNRAIATAVVGEVAMKDDLVFEKLVDKLNSNAPLVRKSAVEALGESKNPKAVEPLILVLLNDKDKQVRAETAFALEILSYYKVKIDKAEAALVESLKNGIRRAAYGLIAIGTERAVETVYQGLASENPDIQGICFQAIECLQETKKASLRA